MLQRLLLWVFGVVIGWLKFRRLSAYFGLNSAVPSPHNQNGRTARCWLAKSPPYHKWIAVVGWCEWKLKKMTQRESKERWIQIYTLALTAQWRSRFVARHTVEVFRLYNCTPPCTVLGGGFSWCAVMREVSRQNESKVQITPSLTSPRCLAFPLGGQKYCRAKSLPPMMMESYPISGTMQNWIAIKQFAHFTGRSVIESVTENLATVPVCFVCVCVLTEISRANPEQGFLRWRRERFAIDELNTHQAHQQCVWGNVLNRARLM